MSGPSIKPYLMPSMLSGRILMIELMSEAEVFQWIAGGVVGFGIMSFYWWLYRWSRR